MSPRRQRYQQIVQRFKRGSIVFKFGLFLRIMLMIFGLSFSLLLILLCLLYLADSHGIISSPQNAMFVITMSVLLGGAMLSLVVSYCINRMVMQPMRQVLNALEEVGRGNFDVRISTDDTMELGVLADAINSMIKSLSNVEMLRDDFIANVSHELKTPLASIQGCAALLQNEDVTDEERRMYAGMVYSSAKRLSGLCGNILELSKLDHGDVQVTQTDFMLDEHLRQALLLLQQDWQQKDIELDLDLDEIKYTGSDELLMQVWLNLLGNAIKFSPQGGRLEVSLEKLDNVAVVTVRDYGIGIEPAEQALVFEKFYQADTSHKTEGNGLGLAMVKKIVDLLGADISVYSEGAGKGASFIVTLPLTQ